MFVSIPGSQALVVLIAFLEERLAKPDVSSPLDAVFVRAPNNGHEARRLVQAHGDDRVARLVMGDHRTITLASGDRFHPRPQLRLRYHPLATTLRHLPL